jgi:polysaccharide biosynthesis/export protein
MKNIFLAFMMLTVLYSCGQYKRFTYIQPDAARLHDSIYNKSFIYYKLQPADILQVNVQSMDKNITEVFNDNGSGSNNSSSTSTSGSSGYMVGHSVDIDGNINLPVMGKIQVAGKSVDEARDLIQEHAEEYIKDAKVVVKLLSFKVYFLGELGGKGMQTIYSDRANILECISLAGDISYNGNRKKVTILRSYQQTTRVIEVDLTRRDLLSSPLYYLQPNDIVYVEPLKSTMFRMRLNEYSPILTFFTSAIAFVVLIKNL